jgi:PEP-CTERM motif
VAGLFLTVVLFQAAPARAEVVFDFSGTCELNCLGTASGILTLADSYVFGTLITDAEFVSFDYSSSSRSFDIISADDPGLIGGLNADGSFFTGEVVFADAGNTPAFIATGNGFEAITEQDSNTNDFGSSATFTLASGAVPEPSTWAMLLLGFAGLGFAGWRRVRQTAVARV